MWISTRRGRLIGGVVRRFHPVRGREWAGNPATAEGTALWGAVEGRAERCGRRINALKTDAASHTGGLRLPGCPYSPLDGFFRYRRRFRGVHFKGEAAGRQRASWKRFYPFGLREARVRRFSRCFL